MTDLNLNYGQSVQDCLRYTYTYELSKTNHYHPLAPYKDVDKKETPVFS